MFAKEHDVSASTQSLLKNKERRRFREALAELARGAEGVVDALVPAKANVEATKLKSKVVLFSLQGEACPLVFDISLGKGKQEFVPTVFAAWRQPAVLPHILVHQHVSLPLLRGADLMAPGVLVPPASGLPDLAKGAPVLIRALGNPMPFAVGVMDVSTADALAGGMRGRLVRILHRFRDALWEAGGRAVPNEGFGRSSISALPEFLAGDIASHGWTTAEEALPEGAGEEDGSGGGEEDGGGEEEEGEEGEEDSAGAGAGAAAAAAAAASSAAPGDGSASGAGGPAPPDSAPAAVPEELAAMAADPSDLLLACTLQALKTRLRASALPLLSNAFFASFVLPCRPRGSTVDAKKSRWGGVGALLKFLEEQGVLVLGTNEEETATLIEKFDKTHPMVADHRAWPKGVTVEADDAARAAAEAEAAGDGPIGAEAATLVPPAVEDFFKPRTQAERVYAVVLQEVAKRAWLRISAAVAEAGAAAREAALSALGPDVTEESLDEDAAAAVATAVAKAERDARDAAEAGAPELPGVDVSHLRHRSRDGMSDAEQRRLALVAPLRLLRTRLFAPSESTRVLGLYASIRGLKDAPERTAMLVDEPLAAALSVTPEALRRAGGVGGSGGGRRGAAASGAGPAFPRLPGAAADAEAAASAAAADAASAAQAALEATLPPLAEVAPASTPIGCLPKKDAAIRFSKAHDPWYLLTRATGDQDCKAGTPPCVNVIVEQVRGRKKHVTHIRGLESLGLPIEPLARQSKKLFACSATTQAVPTDPSRTEAMVQGDVGEGVVEFLVKAYGLPRRLVDLKGGSGGGKPKGGSGGGGGGGGGGKKKRK